MKLFLKLAFSLIVGWLLFGVLFLDIGLSTMLIDIKLFGVLKFIGVLSVILIPLYVLSTMPKSVKWVIYNGNPTVGNSKQYA